MTDWRLPAHIYDHLAPQTHWLESKRRAILDLFFAFGYRLVMPPIAEHQNALAQGGEDLDKRMVRVADPLSGWMLGLRPDMTPQIARIDAHVLAEEGITRLCYCDRVLHAYPASDFAEREPLHMGAEIYGESDLSADVESLELLYRALLICGIHPVHIEITDMGLLRNLAKHCGIVADSEDSGKFMAALQTKDRQAIDGLLNQYRVLPETQSQIVAFMRLQGGEEILDTAAQLFAQVPSLIASINQLQSLAKALHRRSADLCLRFDLADGRGYHYHTGVMFSAFAEGWSQALAHGGRYDGFGEKFGRARAATGFTLNLFEIWGCAEHQSAKHDLNKDLPYQTRIFVPESILTSPVAEKTIHDWREKGLAVVVAHMPQSQNIGQYAKRQACTHFAQRQDQTLIYLPIAD